MTQLTVMDANFLNVEGGTTLTHIGGLGILDTALCPGGRLELEELLKLVRKRAHLARPLRQRLAEVPFGMDRPYWIDDPDFDPARHVQEVTLPRPGDERQLAAEVARLHATPLDRGKPLWEMCLIQGLEGGRAAVYAKVHHAAIDGVMAAETLAALLDLSPVPREVEPTVAEPLRAPDAMTMLGSGLLRTLWHPVGSARSLARTVPQLHQIPVFGQYPAVDWMSRMLKALLGGDASAKPDTPRLSAPPTPFNELIGAHRSFAYASLSLADVKTIRKIMGVSVNDVVMALCATALRRWLLVRDALPDRPLVAAVPVSLRESGTDSAGRNQVSVMLAPLPTNVEDPKERFDATSDAMQKAKRQFLAAPSVSRSWLEDLSGLIPAPVAQLVMARALRLVPAALRRPVNLIISNVPGPQIPLYLCGARVLGYYPISVVSDLSGGLNITVFSYNGNVDVGLVACRDLVEDLWELVEYFHDALEELKIVTGADMSEDML